MDKLSMRIVLCVCLMGGVILWSESDSLVAKAPPDQTIADASLGKSLYEVKCVQCHGKEGKGNGVASVYLNPKPRDFTAGKYKFRTTESGSIPTDEDLTNTVQNGLHGTAMPDWKPFLNGDSLKAVIEYVKSFSSRFKNEQPKVVKVVDAPSSSPASITSGKKVFDKLECASCHGIDGAGTDAIAVDLQDDWGHDIKPTNLTEPWTFRGGSSSKDIYLRFRTGIDGSPMPSYIGSASEKEMWDLANYVVSIARKPVWSMNEHELKEFYVRQDEEAKQNPVARGAYIVNSFGCGHCHTPVREDGSMMDEMRFAGGQRVNIYPFAEVVSYNLTSDKETGLGSWTDDQIKAVLTKGIRRDGSRMLPFPMPWPSYASLKDDDINAIVAYLRTLPAISNKIPDPTRAGIFSYLWGKFQVLILKKDIPGHLYPGNAGTPKEKIVSLNSNAQTEKEARP